MNEQRAISTKQSAWAMAVEADGTLWWISTRDGVAHRRHPDSGKIERSPAPPMDGPLAVLAPGTLLTVLRGSPDLVVINPAGAVERTLSLDPAPGRFRSFLISPDGKWLLARLPAATCVIDLTRGKQVARFDGVTEACFSPDGDVVTLEPHGTSMQLVERRAGQKKGIARAIEGSLEPQAGLFCAETHVVTGLGSVIDRSTGRSRPLRDTWPGAGRAHPGFAIGLQGGLVRWAATDGTLKEVSLDGTIVRSLTRPQKQAYVETCNAGAWVAGRTHHHLEAWHLAGPPAQEPGRPPRAPARKKPAPATPGPTADALFERWFEQGDLEALRVWADQRAAAGDPRGEWVTLHLAGAARTPAQEKRRRQLEKQHGGALVGPARPFLRTWRFDALGLVDAARCEAPLLVEGFAELSRLHPRLALSSTSFGKSAKRTLAALAALPLGKIHTHVLPDTFTDDALVALAPAFEGVRHLDLFHASITSAGLDALARHVTSLESLSVPPALQPAVLALRPFAKFTVDPDAPVLTLRRG